MRGTQKFFGGMILVAVAAGLSLVPQLASSRSTAGAAQETTEGPVPAFHSTVPDGPLPATQSPSLFNDTLAQNAYSLAARIRKVLYQEPCYCHCDRSQGHGSLLDCYVSKHAAVCGVCEREDFYAYEQSHKGKTAAQIREGIVRGDWQQLDITKYESPLPAPSK
ncbi:MAG TPA: CYCXC family (seleno)protein [Candidatus Acidoferrum sp.]|nr:CYCXC family (seleno)protein [Candidatus Acidoferrum sp.]